MSNKPVKTRRVIKVLERLGFVIARRNGSHTIFRNKDTGLIVTVPENRDEIPLVMLRAIERQIGNFNIASDEQLQKLLHS
jgi:predicted RNA binding protein YcfA (HicA-like mRNA interferase family)